MEYRLLSSLFYSNKNEYEKEYYSRFNSNSTYRYDIRIKNNTAFCVIGPEILEIITSIFEKDKVVTSIEKELPRRAIDQFQFDSLIDEIIITNKIEGVNSTRREVSEVLYKLNDRTPEKKQRFDGLINKYKLLTQNETIPLATCQDIRNLYDALVLDEVIQEDADNAPDGKVFRKGSARVQSPTMEIIHTGVYPEECIIQEMIKALDVLHDDSQNLFIRTAVFHYLFGYIHPFYDGNGRTSRFISSYMLSSYLNPLIAYRLSYTIESNSGAYYKAFRNCNDENNKGDLTPFVIMFLKIIEEAMANLIAALTKRKDSYQYYLESLIKQYNEVLNNANFETAEVLLQGTLFTKHGTTKEYLMYLLNVKSRQTIDKRLKTLKGMDLLSDNVFDGKRYYSINLQKLDVK